MTETEWLGCENPEKMLVWLRDTSSIRKVVLFSCACCRASSKELDDSTLANVELAEKSAGTGLRVDVALRGYLEHYILAAFHTAPTSPADAMGQAITVTRQTMLHGREDRPTWLYTKRSALVRDIFGNPFRPVTFSPEWRTSTALALAQQMYDSRDFSPLPILADALQDAGCVMPTFSITVAGRSRMFAAAGSWTSCSIRNEPHRPSWEVGGC